MSNEEKEELNSDNLSHWHCEKCKIRIGVVDLKEKQIRIRYKDLVLYYDWKDQGSYKDKVTVLCRRCGWLNYKSKEELHHLVTDKKEIGYNKQKP